MVLRRIDPNRRTTYIGGQVEAGSTIGSGERSSTTRDADIYAGKVTWTMNPSNTFVVTAFGDPTERSGLAPPSPERGRVGGTSHTRKLGSHNAAVKYTGMLSSSWWSTRMSGGTRQRSDLEPATEQGRNVPRQIDETLGDVPTRRLPAIPE